MKQKVTIVARTVETVSKNDSSSNYSLIKDGVSFDPDIMKEEALILSGKAAGICYMPDDYLSNGIQNNETALKRAGFNSKSGHYSVFDHAHFTFVIETSKAMAMILNSTKLYSTSEKSGRYTSMHPETELEERIYKDWINKFEELIREKGDGKYTDKEINKLAMENARYVLSVFTPTTMMFTIPFTRVILLCEWLDNLVEDLNKIIETDYDLFTGTPEKVNKSNPNHSNIAKTYYNRIANECVELAKLFRSSLNLDKDNPILKDHKNMGINLYTLVSRYREQDNIKDEFNKIDKNYLPYIYPAAGFINSQYTLTNTYSFACLAQEQRHRTLTYNIIDIKFKQFYIPELISDNKKLIQEWEEDMGLLESINVIPQAVMCDIVEYGDIHNYYLKCKERLCMRAQLEISKITSDQVKELIKFVIYNDTNLMDSLALSELLSMVEINEDGNVEVFPRCVWKNYKCNEPCKHVFKHCMRDRII